MSLYLCDGCAEEIPAHKVRVRCQECADYDLCANCAILGTVTGGHLGTHATALHRESGYGVESPPAPAVLQDVAGTPPPPAQWTRLFNPLYKPNPIFYDLANAIFECLDPEKTGYFTPEAYSDLFELLEIPDNVWKAKYESASGPDKEREADYALQQVYDAFGIEYVLRPRQSSSTHPGHVLSLKPLVTKKGFVDFWSIDALAEPAKARNETNLVLQNYQPPIWRSRGYLPAEVFPRRPVESMVKRIADAQVAIANATRPRSPLPRSPLARSQSPVRAPSAPTTRPVPLGSSHATPSTRDASYQAARPIPERLSAATRAAPAPVARVSRLRPELAREESDEREVTAEDVRRAQAELDEMQRQMERDLEHMRIQNEISYLQAQTRAGEDALRSMERSREVMNRIGQDRWYEEDRYR